MKRMTMAVLSTAVLLAAWSARVPAQELSASEVEAWRGPMSEFSAYDLDLSGGLSREEFARAADPRLDDRGFDEFDLNLDGEVGPEELEEVLMDNG